MTLKIFERGSIAGGMLLIAGSCIGAGMLALPIITGIGGFFSSILLIFISWIFMTYTGLLLLEINEWFTQRVNIVSMVGKSRGVFGKAISWILYLFLFYSLLVAYISGSGNILSSSINLTFSLSLSSQFVAVVFVIIFGIIIYFGTAPVDFVNRIFMIGLILSYFGIVFLGIAKLHPKNYLHLNIEYSLIAIPILITSFGFHNMIPSIVSYMNYDYKKVRKAIIGGSLIVLIVYLFWELIVLGIVSFENLFASYSRGIEASQVLMTYLRTTWTGFFVQCFAFFAIVTSFLAQGLGLIHFIADGFKVFPTRKNNAWLILFTLIPPTIFALINPEVFFRALSFAGGICAVILFCLLPAIVVWRGRYKKQLITPYQVFGGKIALIIVIAFSLFVALREILRVFNY